MRSNRSAIRQAAPSLYDCVLFQVNVEERPTLGEVVYVAEVWNFGRDGREEDDDLLATPTTRCR